MTTSAKPLTNQAVIITGGGSGIGQATAKALFSAGASIAVVDYSRPGIDATLSHLSGETPNQRAIGIPVDVRNESDVESMVKRVESEWGRIDILIHAAGILRAPGSGPRILSEITPDEMNLVIDTNLKGTFLCNRAVLRAMIRLGSGQIINISSTSGRKGRAFDSVYCASKFGVVGLSESLAEEVRQYGIKVQVVLPDAVDTPLWDQNGPIRAPDFSLPPERVAEVILTMLTLPADTILENVVIMPFRTRKRRTRRDEKENDPTRNPASGLS
ncbi:MAG: SDR family oxidoreductase [Planctomycetota bacterium]